MKRIRWTEPARDDLRAIHKYIARDSEIYAQRMVDRILRRVEMLETFPEIGGQVEELGRKDIRELIEGHYRIIYRFRNDIVEILTILHAARRFPGHGRFEDEPAS